MSSYADEVGLFWSAASAAREVSRRIDDRTARETAMGEYLDEIEVIGDMTAYPMLRLKCAATLGELRAEQEAPCGLSA